MNPCFFYLLPSLLLIGFAFQSFGEAYETKPLACVLVEEIGGGGSSIPRTIRQTPVELHLIDPLNLIPEAPITSSPETLHLHVTDPSGKLLSPRLSSCEVTYLLPQEVPLAWVRSLTEEKRSPRALGHPWYSLSVKDDASGNTVSAVLGPQGEEDDKLTVFLAVYSTSATLYARLGDPLYVPCGFWRGQQFRSAIEWRHRALGDGKVLYAYDGRLDRIEEIFPGYEMNFSTLQSQGNASLLVDKVAVSDHGTFLCTIYLPYIRAQRDMQLEVTALPTVTFLPNPLFARPNEEITLSCEASHFHPLEISVELLRRLPGDSQFSVLPGVSLSTHTLNKDGTFSLTASLSIIASPEHHGARYFCRVRHISVPEGVTRSNTLHVAGVAGLSLEDGMYLFAVALALYGSLTFLHRKFKLVIGIHESKKDE
ncbi:tapasin [Xenopus laevis]|uniref:Ig-like domain-containing protein n=2 Tax=Xenopus laevis TaxID=8355 RepID=A0A974C3R0_XENLA|nr:tapasin [Xenopus laevis]OCT66164.1 hypothetical protein XELAEV_18042421mg [Xenopus laevis]